MALKLIGTVNLNSGATTGNTGLTLTGIPQTYRDLLIIASVRSARLVYDTDGEGFALNENSSTYSYYGAHIIGTSINQQATSYESFWGGAQQSAAGAASTFNNQEIYIPNYTTSYNKSYLSTYTAVASQAASGSQIGHLCSVYTTNTNSVTSLRIQSATSNGMAQYSAIWIYGINQGDMKMEELNHIEYNCTTGETTVRPFTDEERADYEKMQKLSAERQAEAEAEAARVADLKTSAKAKLVAGEPLTPEEAATIVF